MLRGEARSCSLIIKPPKFILYNNNYEKILNIFSSQMPFFLLVTKKTNIRILFFFNKDDKRHLIYKGC